jgi:putative ABC transport system permease protein
MSAAVAARIARRELRGGLQGFRIFLLCLALGVAAIAAVGSLRAAIEAGLRDQGAVLLGGDAALQFTYRFATREERAWMAETAESVSEIVDFRSMAVVDSAAGAERALTQVKSVDGLYPLKGAVDLDPAMPLDRALAGQGGRPGAVMQQVLIDRLGLEPGRTFRLGTQEFVLMAALTHEPDGAGAGFAFGPRTLVRTEDLARSGLIAPGTLFETEYRLALPAGADLAALKARAEARFRDAGLRWRDSRNGAPGVAQFVDRLGAFLVLVGLAGLAVGGVGVSAAVRAYLDARTATIATLKTLGAQGGTIFLTYLMQIGVLTALGVAAGLVLGAAIPLALGPAIAARLPVPAVFGVYPGPLAEAALYGALTALLFTLWPLARTEKVRAAALYRDAGGRARGWPRPRYVLALCACLALMVGAAVWFSGIPRLALGAAGGIGAALVVLLLAASAIRAASRRAGRARLLRGRPAVRLALGAIGAPGGEAAAVVLSLGLGLSVLAAVGQIDQSLRRAIAEDLPQDAPSYFFVDIQTAQLDAFLDRTRGDPAVARVDTAPMLRGIITRINDQPARAVAGDHWVLQGDRGVTYSDAPPPGTQITEGAWWPEGYAGPPLISIADEEAREMGLQIGDRLTVNILGRDITAEIASFRVVDFSTAGIGFILAMNPAALAGAPHTHIATVYAEEQAEAALLRDIAGQAPNITAIRVRDAIARVTDALAALAAATGSAATVTLITGFVVLIGAAAAGERGRVFEAAILKTLGAARARILWSFALRAALLGVAAGAVAIGAGALAGWAVLTFVMDAPYRFEPVSALAIVTGGAALTLLAGLGFALRPLAARPARVLRAQE